MASPPSFSQTLSLSFLSLPLLSFASKSLPRLNDGLALTPPMGWNSYNHYNCAPNETIIHSNAQALVDLGLKSLGYEYVTVDCGWTLPNRTANGTLTWNPARFPSGYFKLGEYIHGIGLKFGVYSDAGVQMCMTGEPAQVGSLFHEKQDVETFVSWGADLLKYDNCYSSASTNYSNVDYTPTISPSSRYTTMSNFLSSAPRPIIYQICDWGVDFPSLWAPSLGHTYRITNDIIPSYKTIPRILNQAIPQTSFAGPGHWLDLDMLEVGNGVFTLPEEQTHFSLWAILKSPLTIGAALRDGYMSIKRESLEVLRNRDVVRFNQDSLGVAASFRRRWTEEGYEVWAGPLSGERTVVAVVNLKDEKRVLTVDFPDVGVQSAGMVKDIWNNVTLQNVVTSYTATVAAHGTILLELGGTTPAGVYSLKDATVSGELTTFPKVYGSTTSSNYTLTIHFPPVKTNTTILINSAPYLLPSGLTTIRAPLSLLAKNNNTLMITSSIPPLNISITAPQPTFYPSTAFSLLGTSTRTSCPGQCLPVGSKISYLSPTGSAVLNITSPSSSTSPSPSNHHPLNPSTSSTSSTSKFLQIHYINNEIAFSTSWGSGTNTRNLTLSINNHTSRIEVPLSGRSSELFSAGKGWFDSAVFEVLTEGWREGVNELVVGNEGGDGGLVRYGADFVGVGVFW